MINIIIKSMSRYLILAGVLAILGFTVSLFYGIMILVGFISLELATDDESYTAIYFNTEQEEE